MTARQPFQIATICVAVLAPLTAAPAARAAWSGFTPLGPTIVQADPSCAQPGPGVVVCAARGVQNTLVVNQHTTGGWSGWGTIAGIVASSPSCTAAGNGSVICAAQGATSALVATTFNGSKWSALATVGGKILSAPSCGELKAGTIACAARSTSGGLTVATHSATGWSAFRALATSAFSAPGCGGDNNGSMICAWLTGGGTVLTSRFNGSRWSPVLDLSSVHGYYFTTAPTCTPLDSAGLVICTVRYVNSEEFSIAFNGGAWSISNWGNWTNLGGEIGSKTGCAAISVGHVVCTAQNDRGGQLYANEFNGLSWQGWVQVGPTTGTVIGTPACSVFSNGQALCVAVQANNLAVSARGP